MPSSRKLLWALGIASTLCFAQAAQAGSLGFSLGTQGLVADYEFELNPKFDVRIAATGVAFDSTIEANGIEYDAQYQRYNLGVLADYQPTNAAPYFFLTGGLFVLGQDIKLNAKLKNSKYKIGNQTYLTENVKLSGDVKYNNASPYLGISFKNLVQDNNLSMKIDLGILYISEPNLDLDISGQVREESEGSFTSVSSHPTIRQNVEQERQDIEEKMEDYQLLPVFQIGLAYRF